MGLCRFRVHVLYIPDLGRPFRICCIFLLGFKRIIVRNILGVLYKGHPSDSGSGRVQAGFRRLGFREDWRKQLSSTAIALQELDPKDTLNPKP